MTKTNNKPNISCFENEDIVEKVELDFYSYGTQYYRAPTPRPQEWEDDLKEIHNSGYNVVQFRPQWRWHERIRGEFFWDDIDKLVEYADKCDLSFIIKPMLECAPDWVFTELEGYRQDFGNVIIPQKAIGAFYVGGWLPCFDNQDVVKAASEFVVKLVERYRGCDNLIFWNAWNEPRSRPLGECHCQHSVKAYQDYLREKHITVESLNDFYGKAWTSFDSINPPGSARDYAEMFLWRQWATDSVANRIKFVTEVMRNNDPGRKIIAHAGCSLIVQDRACDSSDDHKNAQLVDYYGCSLPVMIHPSNLHEMAGAAMQCDWLRSVDENFWCYELYPNWAGWNEPPSPEFINRVVWNVIACGSKGIVYWQYRSERVGNETNGFGLREIDGSSTDRGNVADSIAKIMQKEGHEIKNATAKSAEIGILYCKNNDLLSRIKLLKEPLNLESPRFDYPYKLAVHGAYLGFWAFDIRTDWVSTNQLERFDNYKYLFVTDLELVDEEICGRLVEYVENGGNLIIEFPFACRESNTWVMPKRPGFDLDALIGAGEKERIDGRQEKIYFTDGTSIDVGFTSVVFDPRGCKVIGRWSNGKPAMIMNRVKKGTVFALGGSLASLTKELSEENLRSNWARLFEIVNIKVDNDQVTKWAGVETRLLESSETDYFIIINHVEKSGEIKLPAKLLDRDLSLITGHADCIKSNEIHIHKGEVICIKSEKQR